MKARALITVFLFLVFTISCNRNVVETENNSKGSLSFSIDKVNAPKNIVEVVLSLTRPEFTTRTGRLSLISDTSATILLNDIEVGKWHLKIDALDTEARVLYSRETDVEVTSNTIVPVNLQLNPTTGGIKIVVTWGNPKMVAYYPFSGNANDYSGLGNNGLVEGATLTEDRFGNENSAYHFDGIDDYIRIPDNNSLTPTNQQLTISAWVKNEGSRNKFILYKGSKYNNREYAMGISGNALAGFSINNHGMWHENQISIGSKINVKDNRWNFFTATWDGTRRKIYVNGKLENSRITDAIIDDFDSDLFIGTYGGEIERYAFKGVIDDIKIYNDVLSDEKIQELYLENGWTGNSEWIDYKNNPLVSGNDIYPNAVQGMVFKHKNHHFMYFSGNSSSGADVYLANSLDGLTWEKYSNKPVLQKGTEGSWDERNVSAGPILKINGIFYMYYTGRNFHESVSAPWHIGIATSSDGIVWTKQPSPVISGTAGAWDVKIFANDIKKINGKYYMYYMGKTELNDHKIGLAISDDGLKWTKYRNNPIMVPDKPWEGNGIYYASVIEEEGKLKMVYQNSYNNLITGFGMAYSTDGINWTKESNNPIFTEDDTRDNYSMVLYPNFQKTENEYRIYYTGKNSSTGRYSINVAIKKF